MSGTDPAVVERLVIEIARAIGQPEPVIRTTHGLDRQEDPA